MRPATAAGNTTIHPDALVTCSSGGACEVYDNRSTGQAFEGETGHGTGLFGTASSNGNGVEGSSDDGYGVLGTSTDDVAVEGNGATGGKFIGTDGLRAYGTTAGFGLYGDGENGVIAVSNQASSDVIDSYSDGGNVFVGFNPSDDNVFQVDAAGDVYNVGATNSYATVSGGINFEVGTGVNGYGENSAVYASNVPAYECSCGDANGLYVDGYVPTATDILIDNHAGTYSFQAFDNGDLTITGTYGDVITCRTCSGVSQPGVHVVSYMPRESEPTMEDFGEGQVTNGSGYVHLDSTFASTIDQTSNYMVFITPEGDNRGLYVTQKSASGFAVRESQGGHSTLAFSWRIVAKPYGDSHARLPIVNVVADLRTKHMARPARPIIHGLLRHPAEPAGSHSP